MKNQDKVNIGFKIILFLILVYFPIFLHMDVLPLRWWDEARAAISAIEMKDNGNYIVPHYEGQPDMWVTKPPLMIWLQVLCLKWLGLGELAVRLPAAIAAFLTAIALMIFSIKYIKSYWFGLIAVLVLVTSKGYINDHAIRTGDYDSLLTLFTTLYCISWFFFLKENKSKYLHLFFIGVALAILTKGFQGVLLIPGTIIYLLVDRKFVQTIKNKWLYIDFVLCMVFILSYYLLREHYTPGYLKRVAENELGIRYLTVVEGHPGPFQFYLNYIVHFNDWYWLIPVGIVTGLFLKNNLLRQTTIFSTIIIVSYGLLLSFSTTKVEWYIVPLFPFFAIVCAVAIFWLFSLLRDINVVKREFQFNILPYLLLFIIFLHPYENIIAKVYLPKENDLEKDAYSISHFLKDAVKSERFINREYVCFDGHKAHLQFYLIMLNKNGQKVEFKDWHSLIPDDIVIACQDGVKQYIEDNYSFEVIDNYYNVKTYKILMDKFNRTGKIVEGRKTINLKAVNNKYVCVDKGQGNIVVADRENASTWETFLLVNYKNNQCALRAHTKLFLCADLAHHDQITASSQEISDWETFTVIHLDSNLVAFKAVNGKYVSVDTKSSQLFAFADSIGEKEKFVLIVE